MAAQAIREVARRSRAEQPAPETEEQALSGAARAMKHQPRLVGALPLIAYSAQPPRTQGWLSRWTAAATPTSQDRRAARSPVRMQALRTRSCASWMQTGPPC